MNNPPTILPIALPVGKFYVYTLAYPDGKVFYVGKGKKNRVDQHEKEAARQCGCPKCCAIRSIWTAGGAVVKAIVFETANENEAYAHERAMIIAARADLCNRTDGCAGRTQPNQNDNRPWRNSWELYDVMYKECLQEIKDIEQRRRQSSGRERHALYYEVRQKRKLLTEWWQRTKTSRAQLEAFLRELGRRDHLLRRPKKPW
jgi:hypothetical protein